MLPTKGYIIDFDTLQKQGQYIARTGQCIALSLDSTAARKIIGIGKKFITFVPGAIDTNGFFFKVKGESFRESTDSFLEMVYDLPVRIIPDSDGGKTA